MRNLRNFVEVARHRSFSTAAIKLGITQSAASQRLLQLEKKLGVTLIDRSVRPLALTPAGEEFLRGCRELLDRYEKLEQRVSSLHPQLEGEVQVDAIYSAGIDLLSQLRESFCKLHPGVKIVLEYKRPEEVYDAVRELRCDLGIVSYPQSFRDVGIIPLRDERMSVICAPTHPLARMKRVHASDLSDWPMVTFETDLPVGRRIRRYLKEHGATPRIDNVFDNIDTLKGAVAVTNEFTILPERTVRRELTAGTLVVVKLEPIVTRPLGVIYRRNGRGGEPFTPVAQAFIDYLLEHAGPETETAGAMVVAGGGNGHDSGPDAPPGGQLAGGVR